MMEQSIVPEIRNLAKYFSTENYWNDNSDNIPTENESIEKGYLNFTKLINENNNNLSSSDVCNTFDITTSNTGDCNNNIRNSKKFFKSFTLSLPTNHAENIQCSLISPTLTVNEMLPNSPNIYFTQNEYNKEINIRNETKDKQLDKNEAVFPCAKSSENVNELPLQRYIGICYITYVTYK